MLYSVINVRKSNDVAYITSYPFPLILNAPHPNNKHLR